MDWADKKTVSELYIFKDEKTPENLLDRLDFTATFEGRQRLSAYLRTPLKTLDQVKSFQAKLAAVRDRLEAWLPLQELLRSDEYTSLLDQRNSRLTFPRPRFSGRWFGWWRRPRPAPQVLFFRALATVNTDLLSGGFSLPANQRLKEALEVFAPLVGHPQWNVAQANWFCFNHHFGSLNQLLDWLYELDAVIGLALAHKKLGLAFPEFTGRPGDAWGFKGLRNLLIKNPVPNDFDVAAGTRLVFLTGPNMAGKSTWLTAVGQAVYLARCGLGVPAEAAVLPWFEVLETAFESSTSFSLGLSYFAAEVERALHALGQCRGQTSGLVLVDELFKGTNVVDSQDCLNYFLELMTQTSSLCLVSTHLSECVAEYQGRPDCQFFSFQGEVADNDYRFSYRLQAGISRQKLGLHILKNRWRKTHEPAPS